MHRDFPTFRLLIAKVIRSGRDIDLTQKFSHFPGKPARNALSPDD